MTKSLKNARLAWTHSALLNFVLEEGRGRGLKEQRHSMGGKGGKVDEAGRRGTKGDEGNDGNEGDLRPKEAKGMTK